MAKRKNPTTTPPLLVERRDTQQAEFIRNEAVKLFAQSGYAATTMDRVCEAVQLNKGTVYYYYKSKASILFHIAETTISGSLESVLSAPHFDSASQTLRSIARSYTTWLFANALAARVLEQEMAYLPQVLQSAQMDFLKGKQRAFLKEIRMILQKGSDDGEFRIFDLEMVERTFIVLLNSVIYLPAKYKDPQAIADTMISLFMKGYEAD